MLVNKFNDIYFEHIDRKFNTHADRLSNEALKKKFAKNKLNLQG